MQYWKNLNNGKIERIVDEILIKHPEKLEKLKEKGYVRIQSENNDQLFSSPKKKEVKKKKKSKK
tara:strand:+ start:153 stop:344 length:192 start_codon:yes stop_codon:yes gene_type:complete